MIKFKMIKGYTIFKHTLLWYMITILIFLLISSTLFLYVANMMKDTVITGMNSALRQSGESIDMLKSSIENNAKRISYDSDIIHYLSLGSGENDVYQLRKAAFSLPVLDFLDHMIGGYYLYDMDKKVIFMKQSAYTRLDEFYNEFFYLEDYDYEKWQAELLETLTFRNWLTARETSLDYIKKRRIPYINSILSSSGFMIGQALFFIDENVILDSLVPILDIGANVVCITNEEGHLIVSTSYEEKVLNFLNPEFRVDSSNMIIEYKSPESGWTYHTVIPDSVVFEGIKPLLNVIFFILFIMIMAGIVMSLIFAYKYSKPFKKMLERIRLAVPETSGLNDQIAFMDKGITNLLASRERLEKNIFRQKELMAETFLFRLMRGGFPDAQSIEQTLLHLEIEIKADKFRGILISLDDNNSEVGNTQLDKLDAKRALLMELLKSFSETVLFYNAISSETIAVLYAESDDEKSCKKFCSKLHETLLSQFGIPSWYYAGIPIHDLTEVYESFSSAEQMLFCKTGDRDPVIILGEDQSNSVRCKYFIEDERKLLNYSAMGDFDKINILLDELYNKNFKHQQMNPFMIKMLIYSMTNTLIKVADQKLFEDDQQLSISRLEDVLTEIPKSHSPVVAFKLIKEFYTIVCRLVSLKRNNRSKTFLNEILSHINQHFSDINISLESVSAEFGVTCQYMSSFFKEHYGYNFSIYLEKIRIDQANVYLQNLQLSMSDIAEKVGYTNVYTFRRAYFRVMGYNPSQHKQMCRKADTEN